nr:MAG TPA: hypothetical protein [Bacteriophage sp.]
MIENIRRLHMESSYNLFFLLKLNVNLFCDII